MVAAGVGLLAHEFLVEMAAVVQAGERIGAAHPIQVGIALSELVLQLLDVHGRADAGEQFDVLEGLLEVVVGTPAQAGHDVVDAAAAGQEHDRNVFELGIALERG